MTKVEINGHLLKAMLDEAYGADWQKNLTSLVESMRLCPRCGSKLMEFMEVTTRQGHPAQTYWFGCSGFCEGDE